MRLTVREQPHLPPLPELVVFCERLLPIFHQVFLNPYGQDPQTATTTEQRMIDPLPALPLVVRDAIQPIADRLGLQTLPLHVHEVLLAATFYRYLNTYLSPALSTWAFPGIYPRLPPRTAINWNIHVVSLVQSIFICGSALWVLLMDHERENSDAKGRIWGYNGAAGMTQAFAAGYFVWDVMVSMGHIDVLGWASLVHAVSALVIVTLGFVSTFNSVVHRSSRTNS